jgi:hypothetical protein
MAKLTAADIKAREYNRGIAELLSTSKTFRKFCWTILTDAGIYMPTYRQGSPAAASDHAYQEGRRALGLEILHGLKFAKDGVLALLEQEGDLLAAQAQAMSNGRADQTLEDEYDPEEQ